MTDAPKTSLLDRLDARARQESIAEENYRREVVERIKSLERARIFAYRRASLTRSLFDGMTGAKDEDEATARAVAVLYRELNWGGESESRREVVERLMPVIRSLWAAHREPSSADGAEAERQLAEFESWFAKERNAPFLSLMDGEVLELPLVEV